MKDLILENLLKERDELEASRDSLKREIDDYYLRSVFSDQDLIEELQKRGYQRGSLLKDGIAKHEW